MGDIDPVNDPFLTVAEVSKMMRVSKMTVYRLLHEDELPFVKVGRSFRVFESDVHKYLSKQYKSQQGRNQ